MSKPVTPDPRKTTVKVGISRLLNTAQYENVQVTLELTDEITWTCPEEREYKTNNLVNRLNKQYMETQTKVLNDLGVQEKRAWRKAAAAPAPTSIGDELSK